MLSADTWSLVFSFLKIRDVENVTETIAEARPAFKTSIFTVTKLRPHFRQYIVTSHAQALQKFNEIAAEGSEVIYTDWKMKTLDFANMERPAW